MPDAASPEPAAPPWRAIAAVRDCLARVPPVPRDDDLVELLRLVVEALGTPTGFLVLAARVLRSEEDPLRGFRIVTMVQHSPAWMHRVVYAFEAETLSVEADPALRRQLEEAGTVRTYREADRLERNGWLDTPLARLMRALGFEDRVVVALPCTPHAELIIGGDRPTGAPRFEPADEATLLEITRGFASVGRRLAISRGFLGPDRRLAPRERETLMHLLGPESEKQIAARLGLTVRSLHQYVVGVYRKFEVHGRAELLSRFLRELA